MDGFYDMTVGLFGDNAVIMLGILVFLATAVLTFGVMATLHSRGAVRRRAAGINANSGEGPGQDGASLRRSSLKAVQRVLDYTSKHYSSGDKTDAKVLRRRLIQAGIYDTRAVGFFFLARTLLAVGLAAGAFFVAPMVTAQSKSVVWLAVM